MAKRRPKRTKKKVKAATFTSVQDCEQDVIAYAQANNMAIDPATLITILEVVLRLLKFCYGQHATVGQTVASVRHGASKDMFRRRCRRACRRQGIAYDVATEDALWAYMNDEGNLERAAVLATE